MRAQCYPRAVLTRQNHAFHPLSNAAEALRLAETPGVNQKQIFRFADPLPPS